MIALYIAIVILIWFVALQIWDLATLLRALPGVRGFLRLIGGACVATVALALLFVLLPPWIRDAYSTLAIVTFLAALSAEIIAGEDVRRAILRKR